MKLDHLSASSLKQAKQCELKLFFKKTQPPPAQKAHQLLIGIVFHEVVAEWLLAKLADRDGQGVSLPDLERLFATAWEKHKSEGDFSKLSEGECRARCWQYLAVYRLKRLNMLFPVRDGGIERAWSFIARGGQPDPSKNALEGDSDFQSLKFTGRIDLLTLDGTVIDHKTASSPWTQAEADADPQAHIYPFALQANGVKADRFIFNVVTKNDVQVLEVKPDRDKFLGWVAYGFELQRAFAEDNILPKPTPRKCGMCEWKNICKFSLAKDG